MERQTNTFHLASAMNGKHAPIWYHLCGRMYQWLQNTEDKNLPWLVTEYGLFERLLPIEFDPPQFEKRLARSYLHFAIWSAFANGHAGTPLKWSDGLNYGEMFPRGTGPFRKEKYPDLGDEMKVLHEFVSSLDDLGTLKDKVACEVTAPGGGPSPVRCWALKSSDKVVAWLFDDDFDKRQDEHWGTSRQQTGSRGKDHEPECQ